MRCDGSPNPFIPSELNTYMNLWREDTSIKPALEVLNEIEASIAVSKISSLSYRTIAIIPWC